jgi:hypothetical protein
MITPFRTGATYLEEALHASTTRGQRQHINKALDAFITASHLDLPDFPFILIQAQFFVGVCYELLEDRSNAFRWWYEKAYASAIKYEREISTMKRRLG